MKKIIFCLYWMAALLQAKSQELSLDGPWLFRQVGSLQWHKATVPGTVHTDLMALRLIPDPFLRDHEKKVQWVEERTWEYRRLFNLPASLRNKEQLWLQMEGLDTYALVVLNGDTILKSDNMFRAYAVDVSGSLRKSNNELLIRFLPAATIAKEQKMAETLALPDNERIYVRKAQYQFGWDWGPRLVTCGIWKSIRLSAKREEGNTSIAAPMAQLVTGRDTLGESFYFTKGGKPIYIKGANWIPADNFLPRAKKLKLYESRIRDASEAGLNMLRVWGGGVYEDDLFYELCDRYGIMVWQDFMFACALYPADTAFIHSVADEVRQQVKRLRKYRCLTLWCGNNEIEEAWFNWGWQKAGGWSAEDSVKLWKNYQLLFHQLIPGIIKELDPARPYWPSSPSLGWGRDSAYKKGDVHYWGVWWGKEKVEKYREKVGRFVSEYGMQGMPSMKTIEQFTLPSDRDTASAVMKTHQKHPFGYENIKLYINHKFRQPSNFKDLVYVSQLMQADAMRVAIEAHRGAKPYNMGTLFWQWNDCWPVVSWSAIDYYGRRKALFYEARRVFSDGAFSIVPDSNGYTIRYLDDREAPTSITYHLSLVPLKGGKDAQPLRTWQPQPGDTVYIRKGDAPTSSRISEFFFSVSAQNSDSVVHSLLPLAPKYMDLQKPVIRFQLKGKKLTLLSDSFAYGVEVELPDGVQPSDNYFHLAPGKAKNITLEMSKPLSNLQQKIRIRSLAHTY